MATKLPITFGVEIEFLFGIDNVQLASNPAYDHLREENAIIHDDDQIDEIILCMDVCDPARKDIERIFQAASVFRRKGVDLLVRSEPKTDEEDFSRWALTREEMVRHPQSDLELSALTNGKFLRRNNCVFSGLELVSPILRLPEMTDTGLELNGLAEVNKFLSHVTEEQGGPCFVNAVPENSSVHVHIGVPPTADGASVDIPLDVLRHLAWICLAFEDAITLLHHPERHGYRDTKIWTNAQPNRVFLGRNDPTHSLHACAEGPAWVPQEEFIKIFNFEYCDDRIDRRLLKELLCTRMGNLYGMPTGKTFVNFANIVPLAGDPAEAKKTIEFRQHHGTLSVEDIDEWVLFVTALVRAAERKANEAPCQRDLPAPFIQKVIEKQGDYSKQLLTFEQAWKYPGILWDKQRSLKELFDLMDLPVDRRRYWWDRARRFRSAEFELYRHKSTCDSPCSKSPIRDCVGWEDGELALPPWDICMRDT
ncbi:hypothetical protein A1O3_08872 [Capronia epimyces CBS 606.96]|uniref:Amidoligase enzyme n=1 Tax=Capronia epimyces CBS 606.96 TaxID=1182542 RepID=W9XPZ2_9EURO|nr:uncharacterized protein A1O3_08872 [Capronia epimyces CBS 606.96]EXJ79370.1 hypothetical protein A1O3_08872 [Capronia epimyces CBS 606.96]